ncbi:uncharacterized protein LDX57_001433 [Aspergillus melleus]|uniref:uncharacterized protein n=1 Tax=Aspergillus melleus TaxID=138277 RepID=UPI001E8CCD6E|nr:uncharacterized protein LDX57_001433 [Aspergillus melleus]KAH8423676.1 hypothetical protein LDX57_001433 [Aspergillus melleus]
MGALGTLGTPLPPAWRSVYRAPLTPEWRHIYRAILRECSYLPDPLARAYHHDFVVQRFRQHSEDPRKSRHKDPYRQNQLRKVATQTLSLFRRANEGYSRPLEKVLRLAYGRRGKKRKDLLDTLIHPEFPTDHMALEEFLSKPSIFSDGWEPPAVMISLMKSQRNAGVAAQMNLRAIKQLAPDIPKENSWGQPVSEARRRNIRKKWFYRVLPDLLPPLPDSDVQILEGLISGTYPWTAPTRRKAVGVVPETEKSLITVLLTEGPQKGETHRKYAAGRPHTITRRFMEKHWRRISSLVPRMKYDPNTQKHSFTWETFWRKPGKLALAPKEGNDGLFEGLDAHGKIKL